MKPSKKNSFIGFCCSFIPGAAEMYMGFMKNGLSLMLVFFLSFMVPSMLGLSDYFVFLTATIWFYSFFHARNMANADVYHFEALEDQYFWEEFTDGKKMIISASKFRKWLGILVIILGVSQLWKTVESILLRFIPAALWDDVYQLINHLPQVMFAIIFIVIGVLLIKGKKQSIEFENNYIEDKEA